MKAKIALIVDVKGWAFDIAATIIQKELKKDFIIDIFDFSAYQENLYKLLKQVEDYDMIHFFWRKNLLPIQGESFKEKCLEEKEDYNAFIEKLKSKLSTGVYDHLFMEDKNYQNLLNVFCKQYVVSSKKLYERYSNSSGYKKPWGILGDTYQEEWFYPENIERFQIEKLKNRPLVIGWVGNSEWKEQGEDIDSKGLHTILNPVIEELMAEGYAVEKCYADRNIKFLPNKEMHNYYKTIDLYVCVSITEGTPKPLLEAMACGIPIITTDVGIAKEVLGEQQKQYIIGQREIRKK